MKIFEYKYFKLINEMFKVVFGGILMKKSVKSYIYIKVIFLTLLF